MASLERRIRELRLSLKMNQTAFGELFGVNQTTVSRWEKGSRPDYDHLEKMASISGVSLSSFFFDEADHPYKSADWGERVSVRGSLETGRWLSQLWWDEDQFFDLRIPTKEEWPKFDYHLTGWILSDESFNRVYAKGSIVIALNLSADTDFHHRSGDKVIALRLRDDGARELTLRQYNVMSDGSRWLWPASNDPRFHEPFPLVQESVFDSSKEIVLTSIIGVVVASYSLEPQDPLLRLQPPRELDDADDA